MYPHLVTERVRAKHDNTSGIAAEAAFSVNGITAAGYVDAVTPIEVGPVVGLTLGALYRATYFVSAGLVLHYGFLAPDGEELDEEFGHFFALLAEARGHYAFFDFFEPWVGLGLGYGTTMTKGEGSWSLFGVSGEGSMTLHGLALSLSVGANFFITDAISVGPFFRMIVGGWTTFCTKSQREVGGAFEVEPECGDARDIYGFEPQHLPHLWTVGVVATYVFSL